MNHTRVAKAYLSWFEQEAPRDAELFWNQDSDYAARYRHAGGMRNAIPYVAALATERLSAADAEKIVEIAKKLVSPKGWNPNDPSTPEFRADPANDL